MRNVRFETRLEEGAFVWLVNFAEKFLARIELDRQHERERNLPEIRKLAVDLQDTERAVARLWSEYARLGQKKRQIQRRLLVLGDKSKLDGDGEMSLEKKLWMFCRIMGQSSMIPHHIFEGNSLVHSERETTKQVQEEHVYPGATALTIFQGIPSWHGCYTSCSP